MKIAVIGAGFFGSIASIELAEHGHSVDLYESNAMILSGASGVNQYRLHRGYHYPRSIETVLQSHAGAATFKARYPRCLVPDRWVDHFYAVSIDSKISAPEYEAFMSSAGLEYERVDQLEIIDSRSISGIYKVIENSIDIAASRKILHNRILESRVNLKLKCPFVSGHDKYDIIVNATYSNLNSIVPPDQQIDYQFEVCEKPVCDLPKSFNRKSVVIIDGEFGCVDPLGSGDVHVMGHVKHAIHATNVGKFPEIPDYLSKRVNSEVYYMCNHTKFDEFTKSLSMYFPSITQARYIWSMYTVRAVLPNREHDDARPSYITKHSDRLYSIFSGKIGTAVDIADELVKMIDET